MGHNPPKRQFQHSIKIYFIKNDRIMISQTNTFSRIAEDCVCSALACKVEPLSSISLAACEAALAWFRLVFRIDSAVVIVACAVLRSCVASECVFAVLSNRFLIPWTRLFICCSSTALAWNVVWKLESRNAEALARSVAAWDSLAIEAEISEAAWLMLWFAVFIY